MIDKLIIIGTLVGQLQVTSYRSVPLQTDDTPFHTSTNERVYRGGAAISRDLLCLACRKLHHRCKRPDNPTKTHYGQYVFVDGMGIFRINDVMGPSKWDKKTRKRYPIKQAIDLWVGSYKEEKVIGVRFNNVYVLKIEDSSTALTSTFK